MSTELIIAIEAAKKGAQKALSYFTKPLDVELKADKSFVTIADKETEKAIISFIQQKFPHALFVGEESGGNINDKEFWIIDPIDGTRSFVHGIDTWCVLIALSRNKEIQLGVCYFPILNYLFYAERGKGAYFNTKQIHTSKVDKLSNAFVNYGSLKYFTNKEAVLRLYEKIESVRSIEATYASCLVTKGSMDASIDAYGELWDHASFKVIIEEAGGKITRLDGSPWYLKGKGSLISNGLIHDQLLEILNKKN